jgi:hypothetical protein
MGFVFAFSKSLTSSRAEHHFDKLNAPPVLTRRDRLRVGLR